MITLAFVSFTLPVAAAGWAALYWLFGGSFFGACVIFIVLKMFGK